MYHHIINFVLLGACGKPGKTQASDHQHQHNIRESPSTGRLDWDSNLNKIAHHMLKWEEKLCSPLGLTEIDVHDIKEIHPNKPELQRYVPTI